MHAESVTAPPALPRRIDAGRRQAGRIAGASRSERRGSVRGLFRRAALRPTAPARPPAPPPPPPPPPPAPPAPRAPSRPRHHRLPGARPPPQGARAARQAVQAGQGRQDVLGRSR